MPRLSANNTRKGKYMKSISVILNEHSKYTIDLKDEYKLDEFIKFFEAKMRIVERYKLDSPAVSTSKNGAKTKATSENLSDIAETPC